MSISVFLGPTMAHSEARQVLDVEYLPPAAVGDVYRAARRRPHAIALIDGYFERTPAVWHKEILWAMAEGVHVFGCSSMGALRAAELADFGMVGIGKVFEAFRSEQLDDDDEVAVVHASAADGYRPLSDAMVNIRATLAAAATQGVLSSSAQYELERIAKDMFYPERRLELVLRLGLKAGILSGSEAERLRTWLQRGAIDQKRNDAVQLLQTLRDSGPTLEQKKRVSYELEHTHTWEDLMRNLGSPEEASGGPGIDLIERAVLDELKRRGDFFEARRAGVGRVLALEETTRMGRSVDRGERQKAAEAFRLQRGLLTPESFRGWLTANHLDVRALEDFLDDEASVTWLEQALEPVSQFHVLDHLRCSGAYAPLRAHVEKRAEVLRERGHDPDAPELAEGPAATELWRWYFEKHLQRPTPKSVTSYASMLGFQHLSTLQTAALKEFLARPEGSSGVEKRATGPDPDTEQKTVLIAFKPEHQTADRTLSVASVLENQLQRSFDFVAPGERAPALPKGQLSFEIRHPEIHLAIAQLTAAEIAKLELDPNVLRVSPNVRGRLLPSVSRAAPAPTAQQIPPGVSQIHAPAAWDSAKGAGIKVAVIDCGVEVSHEDLAPNAVDGVNLTGTNALITPHGTLCAGIIAATDNEVGVIGVAPAAVVVSARGWLGDGNVDSANAVQCLSWCIDNGINIVSMSFEFHDAVPDLEAMCTAAQNAGLLLVASSGSIKNAPPDDNTAVLPPPAAYDSVIAVSAIDGNDQLLSESARAPKVELCAPGKDVLSTALHGKYAVETGTSMAGPHVAGAAAVVWSRNPNATAAAVRKALTDTADHLGSTGRNPQFGFGRVNVANAVAKI